MVPLNNTSSAWFNYYIAHRNSFALTHGIMTVDTISNRLAAEYNGIVIDRADSQGWQPYFKTEQDLTYFVLKWS